MKIKNNTILCVFALTVLAATLGSCRSEDDVLNGLPQGSVPLVLGDVTVAGAQTVNNCAAGGNTRAAISENNATGYTGIRKSRFVDGDVLNLTLSNGSGGSSVTATLTGGKWVLTPAKVFITPGVTEVSATHTATEQIVGIATDDLTAVNGDCVLTAATGKLAISMKHAGAMIDITPGATDGASITSVTVNSDVPTVAEEESAAGGSGTELHYRTLTADATTVSSISAVIGGTTYVATLATPITVAANKRYPVALSFKYNTLTATPSAPQDWTDGGTVPVPGYDRIIDSPEALAQFEEDVRTDDTGTGARVATVIQTADIDLSKLKPVADAGINPLTGTAYTYGATAENWGSGIGMTAPFQGKYNGNGHTISNLKGSNGLFNMVMNASLTGIHLRNVVLTDVEISTGCLANYLSGTTCVTLCSATGSITYGGGSYPNIGGLIGKTDTSSSSGPFYITRCSADVAISISSMPGNGYAGGFIGSLEEGNIAGCMATGNVTCADNGITVGGFAGNNTKTYILGCVATGNLSAAKSGVFIGNQNTYSLYLMSCYATGNVNGAQNGPFMHDGAGSSVALGCAYTGTQTNNSLGISGNVAVADLYATIIASASYSKLADVKTLHWSAADGYTLTEVTNSWYATDVWKDNGTAAPTIDMAYEGWDGKYEGATPNILEIGGQTAYYVAPVNAGTDIYWGDIDFNTICPKGWHVPTKEEFVAMTGLPADDTYYDTNNAALVAVFPNGEGYWSSTEYDDASATGAWGLGLLYETAGIAWTTKMSSYQVRCVRAK